MDARLSGYREALLLAGMNSEPALHLELDGAGASFDARDGEELLQDRSVGRHLEQVPADEGQAVVVSDALVVFCDV